MKKGILLAALLSLPSVLWAQAFQNLDFESAILVPIPGDPYSRVYFSQAFSGWSGFSGTNQQNAALYDSIFLDSTGIGIIDSNSQFFGGAIQGNYTALLQAGDQLGGPDNVPANALLSQTGLVPLGTKSLSFLAGTNSPFTVSLGSTNLNLISFPVPNQNYSLYEADVSAFAGQTAKLTFTLLAENPHVDNRYLTLDAIQFSPVAIPEPSTLILLGVGIVGLVFWRRTRRKTA